MSVTATELLREEPGVAVAARSPLTQLRHDLRRRPAALVAAGFLAFMVLLAVFAPLVTGLAGAPGPDVQNFNLTDSFGNGLPPSGAHLFGTDNLGQDVFSRVVYGARVSLGVSFAATVLALLWGTAAGLLGGLRGGWVDTAVSRTVDVLLAFPLLLFALGIASACSLGDGCLPAAGTGRVLLWAALCAGAVGGLLWLRHRTRGTALLVAGTVGATLGVGLVLRYLVGPGHDLLRPGLAVVIFILSVSGGIYVARLVRGQTLALRERGFVDAARTLGSSEARVAFTEILPNLAGTLIVTATLLVPMNILLEAALSFLGVGIQPPTASWGQMIADASKTFEDTWWYMLAPGVALVATVLAFNVLGDAVQDSLEPRRAR
jgi:peptide/nickel transport system permease protein